MYDKKKELNVYESRIEIERENGARKIRKE